MENQDHLEARIAWDRACESNNEVAKLVRLKYAHELALQKANERSLWWQVVSFMSILGWVVTVITVL